MSKAWRKRSEAGSSWGLRFTIWVAVLLGRDFIGVLLRPITLYFFLVRRVERQASRKFLTRAMNRPATSRDVFRHFYNFARATLDRVYLLSDQADKVPIEKHDASLLAGLVSSGTGGILLGSHMGSFEVARSIATHELDLKIRLVLNRAISQRLIDALEKYSPDFAATIIDSSKSGANLGLVIAEAVRAQEWVGLMGDRYGPGDRTITCQFMGAPVEIPLGPFLIAMVMRAPVIAVFTIYRDGEHAVYGEVLIESVAVARKDREEYLARVAQQYVDRLEHYARLSPYSWFNFFDFWGGK